MPEPSGAAAEEAAVITAGRAAFPEFRLERRDRVTSTQDAVRDAARSGAAAGHCCVARLQTAGRGRQGRRWLAPRDAALLASLLVHLPREHAGALVLAAGLALRAAIEATCGISPQVKWPNDLLIDGGKLAGVIAEVEPAAPTPAGWVAVIVGTGVNLLRRGLPAGAAALEGRAPAPAHPLPLLAAYLRELPSRLSALPESRLVSLRAEWTRHAADLGEPVRATSPAGTLQGRVVGIDVDGALLVEARPGEIHRLLAGDVHLLP